MTRSVVSFTLISSLFGGIGLSLATAPPSNQLDEGRAIYERHCLTCHGQEGRGDGERALSLSPRPGNLVSAHTSAKTDEDLLKIIANGRPRTAMTGWKDRLSDEEQRAVLAYLRSLIRFSPSATPPPATP